VLLVLRSDSNRNVGRQGEYFNLQTERLRDWHNGPLELIARYACAMKFAGELDQKDGIFVGFHNKKSRPFAGGFSVTLRLSFYRRS
jgi:hypothetical protein